MQLYVERMPRLKFFVNGEDEDALSIDVIIGTKFLLSRYSASQPAQPQCPTYPTWAQDGEREKFVVCV